MNSTNLESENVGQFRHLMPIACLFVASLLISNTVAVKLFKVGSFIFPGGAIIFPICYIIGDILTEVYGYSNTRRVIWIGFIAQVIMILAYISVIKLPPADFWPHQQAISIILGLVPRIVIASLSAYLSGEFLNAYILAKMKILTKGRFLWARTIGSSIIGQVIDSFLFVFIAFTGIYPLNDLLHTALSVYLLKVTIELVMTPVTYRIVKYLKRQERIDYFDHTTRFFPIKW